MLSDLFLFQPDLSLLKLIHFVSLSVACALSLARATPWIEDREGLVTPIYAFGVFPHDSWGRFNGIFLAIGKV